MAIEIPVPDTHPGVPWKVNPTDEICFVFSEDVNNIEVDHPDYFNPKIKSGPHKKGKGSKHTPNVKNKTVVFKYSPDPTPTALADTHTILIGN